MPKTETVVRPKRSDGLYPCAQFDSKRSCTFGDACKFSHLGKDDPGLPEGAVAPPKTKRKRNGVCLKFAEHGECEFGDNCRYRHNNDSDFAKKEAADALLIATALGNKDDAQEEKLRRIMALPDHLKVKARAVFFSKQRKGDFKAPSTWQGTGGGGGGSGSSVSDGAAAGGGSDGSGGGGSEAVPKKKIRVEGEGGSSGGGKPSSSGKPACFAFQTGSCKRGTACKFAHAIDESVKAEVRACARACACVGRPPPPLLQSRRAVS
jgi:hypothetical protein